nr:copia protein [Tanacetum cinerariifolium]
MKVEESLNVTFDETPPPPKTPTLEDDELFEEEAIECYLCARYQEDPKTSHLEAVKRIFRYIKGTTHLGLWYPKGSGIETIVYADSDHARDYVDHKSTSGVCTYMGCCLTYWFSKKQTTLAISTTEAEYISTEKACQQALWMKQALVDYGVRLDDILIMCDNKGAIDLSKNPVQHSRTKHIEIRYHFLRDWKQISKKRTKSKPKLDKIRQEMESVEKSIKSKSNQSKPDGVFCRRCTCESCGNGAHIGYNCPSNVSIVSNPEPWHNQNVDELPQTLTKFHPTHYSGDEDSPAYDSTPNFANDSPNVFHPPPQTPTNSYEFCGNDAHYSHDCPPQNNPAFSSHDDNEDYTIAIIPEEPDNSLSMGDEHLDTIPAMKSNEVIKSSVENRVPIPSESEGIPDNTYDVPFHDNSPPLDVSEDQFEEFSDSNDDSTSIDDNYFSIDNTDYVEASPPDFELVSLEEVKDDNLREKLLNINLLIVKIKSLNDNPIPDHVLKPLSLFLIPVEDSNSFLEKSDTSLFYSDNSLPEFETFSNHTEETNSGSTTTHADYSLPKYDSFLFEIEPDQGELTSIVMEDNLAEPRVYVPNVLTNHPTLMVDSDFIHSDNSLPESEIFYFDIEEKNRDSTAIHADICLSDLECFNFKKEPNPCELTSIVDFEIRENVLSATNENLPPEDDHSPLFAYVVWIFLSFLTYPVVPPNLLSFGNEDTIFDPGISNYHFSSFMPGISHRNGTFMKFNVYPNHLNESPMEILSSTTFPKDQ